ncbi:MAG: hypothetical protein HRT89_16690 [Lentisphaeria bacterium]|nr:hypothetical protein [Lentisphaeria bacterium]NQZ69698.1 hypothetical protein [Lentisphaeria bacterium]
MPSHTLNVRVPEKLWGFVQEQVGDRYETPSEFIRELIRNEEARTQQLSQFNNYLETLADYDKSDISTVSMDDIINSDG